MAKKHFILNHEATTTIPFTPRSSGSENPLALPERNVKEHATTLRQRYQSSINEVLEKVHVRIDSNLPVTDGVYLDMELKGSSMPFAQLDTKRGAKLMSISSSEAETTATIFLPFENTNWLDTKIAEYEIPVVEGENPKNKPLLNSIETIVPSVARSLFPDKEEYDSLLPDLKYNFEIWSNIVDEEGVDKLLDSMQIMGIELVSDNYMSFENTSIFLVKASKVEIDDIPFSLNGIEAIRKYYNPAEMIEVNEEQREWEELIKDYISYSPTDPPVIISILDKGVNNGHSLISPLLPDEKRDSVVENTGVGHEGNHGTGMAGLCAYGDLNAFMGRVNVLDVKHTLSSVKLLSEEHKNKPALYGALTSKAIDISANRFGAKIICMAVSEEKENEDGTPASWSASIDKSIYNGGACDRLMIISAGNTKGERIDDPDQYKELLRLSSIPTPGQALNAITVGAYTTLSIAQTPGSRAVAPPEGVSPITRTTFLWKGKNNKPDIVMEGGNYAFRPYAGACQVPELCLISAGANIPKEPLQWFNGTSAASALAANLAAKIKVANPGISMLTVRGLMIHSANWTREMSALGNVEQRMKYCGYGVPNEHTAIASDSTNATFIFENELIPFTIGENKNDNKYNQMHLYEIPWPKELLEQMDSETVKMRVTLSYYIEPSPGFKGNYNKYTYPSASLFFDVKTPTETHAQFVDRNNRDESVAVDIRSHNDSTRWEVGIKRRSIGSVQSDWFECTARELAECNEIGVFPGSGWWKKRKLENVHNRIKYSLIVSIMSSETEIYDEVKVKVENRIVVPINIQ